MNIILHLVILVVLMQALGFVWYGPLFGKLWAEITGMPPRDTLTPEEKKCVGKRMLPVMILNVVLNAITVFAFFFFTQTAFYPIPLAVILFLGFVLPLLAGAAMWSGKPRKLAWKMFAVTAGYELLAFLVMGIFFVLWM